MLVTKAMFLTSVAMKPTYSQSTSHAERIRVSKKGMVRINPLCCNRYTHMIDGAGLQLRGCLHDTQTRKMGRGGGALTGDLATMLLINDITYYRGHSVSIIKQTTTV